MFVSDPEELDLLLRSLILGPLALLWITITVKVVGLRSFSKMTAFDFISTVATGSLLANGATTSEWPRFLQSVMAASGILGLQAVLAWLRRTQVPLRQWLENDPILLVSHGTFDHSALARARVSEADIYAKLREANVANLDQVRAVVLETTGDVSILHGEKIDERLLKHVRDAADFSTKAP